MKKQNRLNDRWVTFVKIVLDPWILLLSIFLFLIIRSVRHTEGFNIHLFVILLIAVLSAIIGAFFIKKWMDLHNENLVVNRGETAIKNLKLIYFNLLRLKKRIRSYIKKLDDKSASYDLYLTFFEETVEKCQMLEEECINSISSWSDVIQEADAKTMLTNVYKLKERKEDLYREIYELKKNFYERDVKERGNDEQFEKQLQQKEFDLKEIKRQITEFENRINNSILSGMTGTTILKEANTTLGNFKVQEN